MAGERKIERTLSQRISNKETERSFLGKMAGGRTRSSVVVHAPRLPPMTRKKIRNIWPVGNVLLARVVALSFPVCVYTRSVRGERPVRSRSRVRDNGEDTRVDRGGGESWDGGLVYSYSHVRQKRPPFLLSLYTFIPSSISIPPQSSSVPVIVSVQRGIKYDLIKRAIVEKRTQVCIVGGRGGEE